MKKLLALILITTFLSCKKESLINTVQCDASAISVTVREQKTDGWWHYSGKYKGNYFNILSADPMTDCEILKSLE